VSYDFEPRLSAEVDFGTATCPVSPDLPSRLGWAPALPRVSRPHLLTEVGSDDAMCPVSSDLASRLGWALALSRVP
jgi:hypothetical protein